MEIIENLDDDVKQIEILPRLPAQSLRHFQTLLSDPNFIKVQLSHCQSSKTNRLVVFTTDDRGLHCLSLDSLQSPARYISFPPSFTGGDDHSEKIATVGSCNGLVCISATTPFTSFTRFMLFNPMLLNLSTPVFNITAPFDHSPTRSLMPISINFGFGFDSISDDYKIVAIVDYREGNDERTRDVMIYSSKVNSWRLVETATITTPKDSLEMNKNGILLHNHLLHWIVRNSSEDYSAIRCFDLEGEKWVQDDIPFPNYHENYTVTESGATVMYYHKLAVLEKYLCLLVTTSHHYNHAKVSVWIKKEECWVKLLSLPDLNRNPRIFPLSYHDGSTLEISLTQEDGNGNNPAEFVRFKFTNDQQQSEREITVSELSWLRDAHICLGSLVSLPQA